MATVEQLVLIGYEDLVPCNKIAICAVCDRVSKWASGKWYGLWNMRDGLGLSKTKMRVCVDCVRDRPGAVWALTNVVSEMKGGL